MRHFPQTNRRPVVCLLVDTCSAYGRAILRGIMRYANMERRWLLFIDMQRFLLETNDWPHFDGIIFAGFPGTLFDKVHARCPRAVYCSGGADPAVSPMVGLDDLAVGKLAAEHLLNRGLRHFGFYGHSPGYKVSENRFAGFRAAVEAKGYTCSENPFSIPLAKRMVLHKHRPQVISWLATLPKPIGIMAFDDGHAHDLAGACQESRIAVPDQIALIGVNNDDLLCESAWPPLSSIEADFSRVGFRAAEIIDLLLSGKKLSMAQRENLLPPLEVVERQSTNVLAVNDPNVIDAIRFIGEHACDPCSVEDVLRAVPVNRRWLERNFVTQFDRTIHDEIVRVRIDTAKRLLRDSKYSIDQIGARCGFAESKWFYALFRRLTGTSPAAYRRMARSGTAAPLFERPHKTLSLPARRSSSRPKAS